MKKWKALLLLGASTLSFAALAANSLDDNSGFITKADPVDLSVTYTSASVSSSNSNLFEAKTNSGNLTSFSISNCINGASGAICTFRSNGAGIYGKTAFQAITSVEIEYSVGSTGGISLYFDATTDYFKGQKVDMLTDQQVGVKNLVSFNAASPSDSHYINIWSTNETTIYSITIHYTCE